MSSRKLFYDLLPVGHKQTSFIPTEASAFVNKEAKNWRTTTFALCCHHSRDEIWPPEQNNREFKITTTATATGTSLNKRFNEQNNGSARAL